MPCGADGSKGRLSVSDSHHKMHLIRTWTARPPRNVCQRLYSRDIRRMLPQTVAAKVNGQLVLRKLPDKLPEPTRDVDGRVRATSLPFHVAVAQDDSLLYLVVTDNSRLMSATCRLSGIERVCSPWSRVFICIAHFATTAPTSLIIQCNRSSNLNRP